MSRPWIKLYTEMLNDPKMILLSDSAYRRFIEMLLFAGEVDDTGRVGPESYIAIKCHQALEDLAADLNELAAVGIVHRHAGEWFITAWSKRQPAETVNDRVKRYRDSQAQQTGNNTVTLQSRYSNAIDKEIDKDIDKDIDKEKKKKGKAANAAVVIPDSLATMDFLKYWDDWNQHRTEIKKRQTPRSMATQLKVLATIGPGRAIAAIQHSIANGYTGIYEPKPTANGQHSEIQKETTTERLARLGLT